jgi:DNA-binding CsgD family transcriptional regulator
VPATPFISGFDLTLRERQVLALLVGGASNKEMARRLSIRSNTVRTHVQNLFQKLQVNTRLEAVTVAIDQDRKENLTVSISGRLLRDVRRYKGQIAISEVVEEALAAKVEEVRDPEKAQILRRLRVERDERRGPDFQRGFQEGQRWAKATASWAEIQDYVKFSLKDVVYEWGVDTNGFAGSFSAPADDYPDPYFRDENDVPVTNAPEVTRYWRGWLSGVRSIYNLVKDELLTRHGVDHDGVPT